MFTLGLNFVVMKLGYNIKDLNTHQRYKSRLLVILILESYTQGLQPVNNNNNNNNNNNSLLKVFPFTYMTIPRPILLKK